MTTTRPLSTLLSQALVAFTIEFDNEAERQLHAATDKRPFLVSLAMWSNCMRYVGPDGCEQRELERLARTPTNLVGMQRWRYVDVGDDGVVRATKFGRLARRIWEPLVATIEGRWIERFGDAPVEDLRASLLALDRDLDRTLPDCPPILGYGLSPKKTKASQPVASADIRVDLPAVLSRVVTAFAREVEMKSPVSLAIAADVMRSLDDDGALQRDLSMLGGIATNVVPVAVGFLEKRGYAVVAQEAGSRGKRVRLTPDGIRVKRRMDERMRSVETRWGVEFGERRIGRLRAALEAVLDADEHGASLIARGLIPPPDGWRARTPYATQTRAMLRDPRGNLPHFPMVLHRGGWPDGS